MSAAKATARALRFLIALCAALYPILAYLKARLEPAPTRCSLDGRVEPGHDEQCSTSCGLDPCISRRAAESSSLEPE
jgi:hypothetical protein